MPHFHQRKNTNPETRPKIRETSRSLSHTSRSYLRRCVRAFYTRHQNNFSAVTLTSCFPSSASKQSYCSHVSACPQHVDTTTGSPRGMGANTRPGKAGSRLTTATLVQCSRGLLRAAAPQVATAAQLRIQRNRNVATGCITSTKKASER